MFSVEPGDLGIVENPFLLKPMKKHRNNAYRVSQLKLPSNETEMVAVSFECSFCWDTLYYQT